MSLRNATTATSMTIEQSIHERMTSASGAALDARVSNFTYPDDAFQDPLNALKQRAQVSPDKIWLKVPSLEQTGARYLDISYAQANSIADRLASSWSQRLAGVDVAHRSKPIAVCSLEARDSIFHLLALTRLGVGVHYIHTALPPLIKHKLASAAGCQGLLCSDDDAAIETLRQLIAAEQSHLAIYPIKRDEYLADQLALLKSGGIPAPVVRSIADVPRPYVVTHSSGSTGMPKNMAAPHKQVAMVGVLPWYLITSGDPAHQILKPADSLLVAGVLSHNSSHALLLGSLMTGITIALPLSVTTIPTPMEHLDSLVEGDLQGGFVYPHVFWDMMHLAFESDHPRAPLWAAKLRSIHCLSTGGACPAPQVCDKLRAHGLPVQNLYGLSETGLLLTGTTDQDLRRLYPNPGARLLWVSDEDDAELLHLWVAQESSCLLRDQVTLDPFPGKGPYQGRPAFCTQDIFRAEVESDGRVAYFYVGRNNDFIKHSVDGGGTACLQVEDVLIHELRLRLGKNVEAVQVFGHSRPSTALVVQLGSHSKTASTQEKAKIDGAIAEAVAQTNMGISKQSSRLQWPGKGRIVWGDDDVRLARSPKGNLRRLENESRIFKDWLDSLWF